MSAKIRTFGVENVPIFGVRNRQPMTKKWAIWTYLSAYGPKPRRTGFRLARSGCQRRHLQLFVSVRDPVQVVAHRTLLFLLMAYHSCPYQTDRQHCGQNGRSSKYPHSIYSTAIPPRWYNYEWMVLSFPAITRPFRTAPLPLQIAVPSRCS